MIMMMRVYGWGIYEFNNNNNNNNDDDDDDDDYIQTFYIYIYKHIPKQMWMELWSTFDPIYTHTVYIVNASILEHILCMFHVNVCLCVFVFEFVNGCTTTDAKIFIWPREFKPRTSNKEIMMNTYKHTHIHKPWWISDWKIFEWMKLFNAFHQN